MVEHVRPARLEAEGSIAEPELARRQSILVPSSARRRDRGTHIELFALPLTDPAPTFFVLGLLILLAPLVAERLKLPGVIGLVVAGVVVGPEGIGLLDRPGTIAQLGGVGLLYLMFLAGLELDLGVLSDHRRSAIVFGLLTFAIPITVGTTSALLLGYGTTAAVLIGSLWASHTLVAYPIIRRGGIVTDPAVAATVGATVITDTLALLVLAVVAGLTTGGSATFLFALLPGLALLGGVTLWILPRMAAWFFAGLGPDRTLRFLFVLTAVLGSAVLAETIGIEGIVGAFLAGLSLNRLVPNGGALMQRIEFVGSALLIPIFLISVGMLVNLGVVFDIGTLVLAAAFSGVAMGSKALAAIVAGRIFGFDNPQIGVMFALSNSQAAATLAATVVGFEIGLFDERVVNAVLIVIFVTVMVSSWAASRSVHRFNVVAEPSRRLGQSVLVPIANPSAAGALIQVAAWVARADGGEVTPLHVVTDPSAEPVRRGRETLEEVVQDSGRFGVELDGLLRVDRSVASGIRNTALEKDASLVLLGWKGSSTTKDRMLGDLLTDVTEGLPCASAVCWFPSEPPKRLVVALGHEAALEHDIAATAEVVRRLSKGAGMSVVVASTGGRDDPDLNHWPRLDAPGVDDLIEAASTGDLIVLPAPDGRELVGATASALAARRTDVNLIVVRAGTWAKGPDVGEVFTHV